MRISCAVCVPVSVVTAAVLLVLVPAATAVTHTGSGTYNYPPLTTAAGELLYAEDTTKVNVLPGGIVGGNLDAYDNSTVNVSGGSVGGNLVADYNSTVNVSGGTIGDDLYAISDSTVTVIGSFNLAYGDYFDGGPLDGLTLTGLLADGTPINNTVNIYNSATVTLAAPVATVPEPATAALVLLGAGGLMCRRRAA